MKKVYTIISLLFAIVSVYAHNPRANVSGGIIEGIDSNGINVFKGIPFAAPPVGGLRWKAPQPVEAWDSVRTAYEYGPSPMQQPVFGDIEFGPAGISEDCLYLNVWAPEHKGNNKLPVLIYFNGGALIAGSGAEPRYSGLSLAKKGIIVVTANYREGIFGFFSHPELSEETEYNGSGNYGFMDMVAAIQWVKDNIAEFGGDPDRITVAGESAGSMSVCALMASPLCDGLFSQAIGSSGSSLFYEGLQTLGQAEKNGVEKANLIGCSTLSELRDLPALELLEKSQCNGMMPYTVDGYFMTRQPLDIFDDGEQLDIPLLVGGNSHEVLPNFLLWGQPAGIAVVRERVEGLFGDATDHVLKLYGIENDVDADGPGAVQLASDMFIGFTTWKWANAQAKTGTKPVYRYNFTHSRPWKKGEAEKINEAGGALHAADIEYAMGNLETNEVYDWQPGDYTVSELFSDYYVNFVKTGNPNSPTSDFWPSINGKTTPPVLQLDVTPKVVTDSLLEDRYLYIDKLLRKKF